MCQNTYVPERVPEHCSRSKAASVADYTHNSSSSSSKTGSTTSLSGSNDRLREREKERKKEYTRDEDGSRIAPNFLTRQEEFFKKLKESVRVDRGDSTAQAASSGSGPRGSWA